MAWAFGTKTDTTTSSGTSPTGARPASTALGDLLVAVAVFANAPDTVTPPVGWSSAVTYAPFVGTAFANVWQVGLYYKIATGSEPATWTWTTGVSQYSDISVLRYTGTAAVQANVLDTVVHGDAAVSASITAPTLTTSQDNDLVLYFLFGASTVSITWAAATGTTLRANFDGADAYADEVQAVAGATTSRVFNQTNSGTFHASGAITAAFRASDILPPGLGPGRHMEPTQTMPIGW